MPARPHEQAARRPPAGSLTRPAPSFASWIVQVTPEWERLTAFIEADEDTKKALGWVREMYAFSAAVALQGIKLDLQACAMLCCARCDVM